MPTRVEVEVDITVLEEGSIVANSDYDCVSETLLEEEDDSTILQSDKKIHVLEAKIQHPKEGEEEETPICNIAIQKIVVNGWNKENVAVATTNQSKDPRQKKLLDNESPIKVCKWLQKSYPSRITHYHVNNNHGEDYIPSYRSQSYPTNSNRSDTSYTNHAMSPSRSIDKTQQHDNYKSIKHDVDPYHSRTKMKSNEAANIQHKSMNKTSYSISYLSPMKTTLRDSANIFIASQSPISLGSCMSSVNGDTYDCEIYRLDRAISNKEKKGHSNRIICHQDIVLDETIDVTLVEDASKRDVSEILLHDDSTMLSEDIHLEPVDRIHSKATEKEIKGKDRMQINRVCNDVEVTTGQSNDQSHMTKLHDSPIKAPRWPLSHPSNKTCRIKDNDGEDYIPSYSSQSYPTNKNQSDRSYTKHDKFPSTNGGNIQQHINYTSNKNHDKHDSRTTIESTLPATTQNKVVEDIFPPVSHLSPMKTTLRDSANTFTASQSPISQGSSVSSFKGEIYDHEDYGLLGRCSHREGSSIHQRDKAFVKAVGAFRSSSAGERRIHLNDSGIRQHLQNISGNVSLKGRCMIDPKPLPVEQHDKENTRRGKVCHQLKGFPDPIKSYSTCEKNRLGLVLKFIKRLSRAANTKQSALSGAIFSLSRKQIMDITLKILLDGCLSDQTNGTKDTNEDFVGHTVIVARTKEDLSAWENAFRDGTGYSVWNHAASPLRERKSTSTAKKCTFFDIVLTTFDAIKSPDAAIPIDASGYAITTMVGADNGWYSSRNSSQSSSGPQLCKKLSVLHRIRFKRVIFIDILGRKSFVAKLNTARAAAAVALHGDCRFVFFSQSEADGKCGKTALLKSHRSAMESLSQVLKLTDAEQSEAAVERHMLELEEDIHVA